MGKPADGVVCGWAKHLRREWKQRFWRKVRRKVKREINGAKE